MTTSVTKIALLAGAITAASATAAFAQDPASVMGNWDWKNGVALIVSMDGKAMSMRIGEKGNAMIMGSAKPLANDVLIYKSGGKYFMVENHKMDNGHMMFQDIITGGGS